MHVPPFWQCRSSLSHTFAARQRGKGDRTESRYDITSMICVGSQLCLPQRGNFSKELAPLIWVEGTGSACSGLLVAGMLSTVQAVKIVKYLPHQYRSLFALTNSVGVNSSLNTTSETAEEEVFEMCFKKGWIKSFVIILL